MARSHEEKSEAAKKAVETRKANAEGGGTE